MIENLRLCCRIILIRSSRAILISIIFNQMLDYSHFSIVAISRLLTFKFIDSNEARGLKIIFELFTAFGWIWRKCHKEKLRNLIFLNFQYFCEKSRNFWNSLIKIVTYLMNYPFNRVTRDRIPSVDEAMRI